jgi:thioredoxin 1
MIIDVTTENVQQEVVESKLPVIIDVNAVWCGPCQMMAPIFEELDKELGSTYKFLSLNVDEARELAIEYGVSSVPTFIFINNNEIKGRETGSMSKERLMSKITEYLG